MKLSCPIKGCRHKIEFVNKPDIALLEYLEVYNRFEKHLLTKHSISQIIAQLYHMAIQNQF